MTPEFDAIIVGARVAGSITATLLAEHGHKVLLLDRAHFPSDTLSTHFFRSYSLKSFERIGVFDQVQSAAPHMVNMFNDIDGHVWTEAIVDKNDLNYFLCVRRITLDTILTTRAQKESNVNFIQGARFTELLRENGSVAGAAWIDDQGRHEATARAVVGADGFYSQVAKLVGPKIEEFEPVHRAMYYSYFQNLPSQDPPAAEHYFRGDHLVYVFSTDADLTMVSVSVPITEFGAYKKDATREMMSILKTLPGVAPRLAEAEMVAPVKGAGNIPCYLREPYGDGWVLVGDSGLVFDPWSGQGIDHASQHAVILADSLHEYFENKRTWGEAMAGFHDQRNRTSKKNFERTRVVARDLRKMTQAALRSRGYVK